MFYSISLYASLAIFGIGLIYKISTWFRYKPSPQAGSIPISTRVFEAIKGILSALLTKKGFILIKVFILDVLFQRFLLKEGFLRWFSHTCIYGGFMLLLLMHALDELITSALFPGYYSTSNPFMFLRNLFGAMVILGLILSLYRRVFFKGSRPRTTFSDYYAIVILATIIISGSLLEATKMISYSRYKEMVEEYSVAEEEKEFKSLEAFWVKEFGVVSPYLKGPFDEKTLKEGKELHDMSCARCHSHPHWAFMSYSISKVLRPIALFLDRVNMHTLLLYLHFITCFLGLALIPFSKFFHIFATPINILVNTLRSQEESNYANLATRQIIELDACTHCGNCTIWCPVSVAFEVIPNLDILPSERLISLKKLSSGKKLSKKRLMLIQEGIYTCTDCHRCTDVCPIGIDLEALWSNMRESMAQLGYQRPEAFARGAIKVDFTKSFMPAEKKLLQEGTFSVCFGCQSCTNVCPIVANYKNPKKVFDLMPHEIMHALALGCIEVALSSKMIWDCATCYICQEQCPQGVCITDILYELRNISLKYLKEKK